MSVETTEAERMREIDERTELYVRLFNKGDADALDELYTGEGVVVWGEDGTAVGGADRKPYVREFLAGGPTMTKAEVKHSYVTADTALLVVEWAMDVPSGDGSVEHLTGKALDVLRRGDDGLWRYAIDHPYGDEH